MTADRTWAFPVLAIALAPRGGALVAMERPFHVDARLSWRKATWRYIERVSQWLEPRSILMTHGARLESEGPLVGAIPQNILPADARGEVLHVRDACAILGCLSTLPAVSERLLDMYPLEAARLRCFETGSRSDRARAARPLLSAFAVAHAASVNHLIKFG